MEEVNKKSETNKNTFKDAKTKKRNWTFVLYPESAPSDWRDILTQTGLTIAVSPLHDKDINPDGEPKKAHYHIILCYEGPTTGSIVKKLVDELNQPIPQPIDSVRGLYRYFTHKDNPEKAQYNENNITTINGFDISNYADLSVREKEKIKAELMTLIDEAEIHEYSTFMKIVKSLNKPDYFHIASTNTIFFNTFITSLRNIAISPKRRRHEKNNKIVFIDEETGEVIIQEPDYRETEEPKIIETEEPKK